MILAHVKYEDSLSCSVEGYTMKVSTQLFNLTNTESVDHRPINCISTMQNDN